MRQAYHRVTEECLVVRYVKLQTREGIMSPKKNKANHVKVGRVAPKNAQEAKKQITSLLSKNAQAMKALA